jgi:hypothetical protein
MNLDVIKTLVVDEKLVLCRVLPILPPRGSAKREGEAETKEGQLRGLGSKPAATTVIVLGALLP